MSDDDPLDSAVTLIGAIDQGTQSSRFIVYNPKDLSVPVGCVVP
jgi:glycerol kinase